MMTGFDGMLLLEDITPPPPKKYNNLPEIEVDSKNGINLEGFKKYPMGDIYDEVNIQVERIVYVY